VFKHLDPMVVTRTLIFFAEIAKIVYSAMDPWHGKDVGKPLIVVDMTVKCG